MKISTKESRETVALIAANTTISAAVGVLVSMFLEWGYAKNFLFVKERHKKIETSSKIPARNDKEGGGNKEEHYNKGSRVMNSHSAAVNGALAGLVSITAGCATMHPGFAILVGMVAAAVYHYFFRMTMRWNVDDVVNASPIHLWCGVWGVLAAGLFSTSREVTRAYAGALGKEGTPEFCGTAKQLWANVAYVVILIVGVTVWNYVISLILLNCGRPDWIARDNNQAYEEELTHRVNILWTRSTITKDSKHTKTQAQGENKEDEQVQIDFGGIGGKEDL
ncbi:unnamed protein product [Discosporangium mesarthrocarpum]